MSSSVKGRLEESLLCRFREFYGKVWDTEKPKLFDRNFIVNDLNCPYIYTDYFKKVFSGGCSSRIIQLVAEGGCGKSAFMMSVFHSFLGQTGSFWSRFAFGRSRRQLQYLHSGAWKVIPVYIKARRINVYDDNKARTFLADALKEFLTDALKKHVADLKESDKKSPFIEVFKKCGDDYRLLILVDGFNEVSRTGYQEHIRNEMVALCKESPNVFVLVSGREPSRLLPQSEIISLEKLTSEEAFQNIKKAIHNQRIEHRPQIEAYIHKELKNPLKPVVSLLRNPLLLDCFIQAVKNSDNINRLCEERTELLSAFYKTIQAKENGKATEELPKSYRDFIFYVVLPMVASYMERKSLFRISQIELHNLLCDYLLPCFKMRLIRESAASLKNYKNGYNLEEVTKSSNEPSDSLFFSFQKALGVNLVDCAEIVSRIRSDEGELLIRSMISTMKVLENRDNFYYLGSVLSHQVFRDYLSALHIYNQITNEYELFSNPLVSGADNNYRQRLFDSDLAVRTEIAEQVLENIGLLCQKEPESNKDQNKDQNMDDYLKQERNTNLLYTVLDSIGRPDKNDDLSKYNILIHNLLDILKISRDGLWGWKFKNLDLNSYSFNGVKMTVKNSKGDNFPCIFDGCRVNPNSFLPTGAVSCLYPFSVSAAERGESGPNKSDLQFLAAGAPEAEIRIWNVKERSCIALELDFSLLIETIHEEIDSIDKYDPATFWHRLRHIKAIEVKPLEKSEESSHNSWTLQSKSEEVSQTAAPRRRLSITTEAGRTYYVNLVFDAHWQIDGQWKKSNRIINQISSAGQTSPQDAGSLDSPSTEAAAWKPNRVFDFSSAEAKKTWEVYTKPAWEKFKNNRAIDIFDVSPDGTKVVFAEDQYEIRVWSYNQEDHENQEDAEDQDTLQTLSIQDAENQDALQTLSIQDAENQDALQTLSIQDAENQDALQTQSIQDAENQGATEEPAVAGQEQELTRAVGNDDPDQKIANDNTGGVCSFLGRHDSLVADVQFQKNDSDIVYTAGSRGGIRKWKLSDCSETYISRDTAYRTTKMCVGPDQKLYFPSSDGTVKVYSIDDKIIVSHLNLLLHQKEVKSVAWTLQQNDNGRITESSQMLSCSNDGTVALYDSKEGKLLGQSVSNSVYYDDVAGIAAGYFVTVTRKGVVQLWSICEDKSDSSGQDKKNPDNDKKAKKTQQSGAPGQGDEASSQTKKSDKTNENNDKASRPLYSLEPIEPLLYNGEKNVKKGDSTDKYELRSRFFRFRNFDKKGTIMACILPKRKLLMWRVYNPWSIKTALYYFLTWPFSCLFASHFDSKQPRIAPLFSNGCVAPESGSYIAMGLLEFDPPRSPKETNRSRQETPQKSKYIFLVDSKCQLYYWKDVDKKPICLFAASDRNDDFYTVYQASEAPKDQCIELHNVYETAARNNVIYLGGYRKGKQSAYTVIRVELEEVTQGKQTLLRCKSVIDLEEAYQKQWDISSKEASESKNDSTIDFGCRTLAMWLTRDSRYLYTFSENGFIRRFDTAGLGQEGFDRDRKCVCLPRYYPGIIVREGDKMLQKAYWPEFPPAQDSPLPPQELEKNSVIAAIKSRNFAYYFEFNDDPRKDAKQ